jgi:hypothetical protein
MPGLINLLPCCCLGCCCCCCCCCCCLRFDGLSGAMPDGMPRLEVPAEVLDSIRRNKVCAGGHCTNKTIALPWPWQLEEMPAAAGLKAARLTAARLTAVHGCSRLYWGCQVGQQ